VRRTLRRRKVVGRRGGGVEEEEKEAIGAMCGGMRHRVPATPSTVIARIVTDSARQHRT